MTELLDLYTYRVLWSDDDGMFIGSCAELPYLSHLDDTAEGAFTGIRDVTATALEILKEDSDPLPKPLSTRKYSGVFTVRVPPETHRALALDAAEAGVSLNRLAAERLSLRR